MHRISSIVFLAFLSLLFFTYGCGEQKPADTTAEIKPDTPSKPDFGGFETQVKWGEHLVTIGGCNDCHTPKKFGPAGMMPNDSLKLSGHVAAMPVPDIDRKMIQKKQLLTSNDLTVWVGPWGVSFAANLTPDSSGIGAWKEEQFIMALRQGITKGLPGSRHMLPPMPWQGIGQMSDPELKAVFAYLKSIPAIKNTVPAPLPPVQ